MFGCKICNNELHLEIDSALISSETLTSIRTKFNVAYNTLRKHKINCLQVRMKKALKLYEQSQTADLVDEIVKMKEEALSILAEARAAGNLNVSLNAIDRVVRILEALLHEAQPKQKTVYVQTIESKIVMILGDFPEARKKVLEVLYDDSRTIESA